MRIQNTEKCNKNTFKKRYNNIKKDIYIYLKNLYKKIYILKEIYKNVYIYKYINLIKIKLVRSMTEAPNLF